MRCDTPHSHSLFCSTGPPLRTSLARLLRQHLIFLPADAFLLAKNLARYFDSCHNRIHQSTEGGSSELLKKFHFNLDAPTDMDLTSYGQPLMTLT